MRLSLLFPLSAAVLLSACMQQPPASGPGAGPGSVPVLEPAPTSAETVGEPVPAPRPPQPARQLADGSQLPAVKGLLAAADKAQAKGDVELAAVNLERAQRLAPQSVQVYQRLAKIRLAQKRPAEAEQMARKALAYTSTPAKQAELWRLIASARRQRGQQISAGEAEAKAAALEATAVGGQL